MSVERFRCALTLEHFSEGNAAYWCQYLGLPDDQFDLLVEDLCPEKPWEQEDPDKDTKYSLEFICSQLSREEQWKRWNTGITQPF